MEKERYVQNLVGDSYIGSWFLPSAVVVELFLRSYSHDVIRPRGPATGEARRIWVKSQANVRP